MSMLGIEMMQLAQRKNVSVEEELQEIKEYLFTLTKQLKYTLTNLDGENFERGFYSELTDGNSDRLLTIEQNLGSLASSVRRMQSLVASEQAAIGLLDARIDTLESKTTNSAIVNTVRSSAGYQADLADKASVEAVLDIEADVAGLRETLDAVPHIVSGTATINSSTGVSISFGDAFSSAPHVIASYKTAGSTPISGSLDAIQIYGVTASGATLIIGGSNPASADVDWVAIGL